MLPFVQHPLQPLVGRVPTAARAPVGSHAGVHRLDGRRVRRRPDCASLAATRASSSASLAASSFSPMTSRKARRSRVSRSISASATATSLVPVVLQNLPGRHVRLLDDRAHFFIDGRRDFFTVVAVAGDVAAEEDVFFRGPAERLRARAGRSCPTP